MFAVFTVWRNTLNFSPHENAEFDVFSTQSEYGRTPQKWRRRKNEFECTRFSWGECWRVSVFWVKENELNSESDVGKYKIVLNRMDGLNSKRRWIINLTNFDDWRPFELTWAIMHPFGPECSVDERMNYLLFWTMHFGPHDLRKTIINVRSQSQCRPDN